MTKAPNHSGNVPMSTLMAFGLLTALLAGALAQDSAPELVTPENFNRAETDLYFTKFVRDGSVGAFTHVRQPASVEDQTVIRMNRDTLYSNAVFDLDAGPVTITLPDAGGRYMALQTIDEDHYVVGVYYDGEPHSFSKEEVGTRYFAAIIRTLVNPDDPTDLEAVHKLQDGVKVEQAATGSLVMPAWDPTSQDQVRSALLALGATMANFDDAFGSKAEVDPIKHLVGTAVGWGGNPDKDARYFGVIPARNDGKTVYKLHVPADVPVDGFWSVSVYNAKGFFEPNPLNAYSLNNITATRNEDESVDVQFGGCDGKVPNCLPTPADWNYTVRLYRPRAGILDGSWKFPEAEPAG